MLRWIVLPGLSACAATYALTQSAPATRPTPSMAVAAPSTTQPTADVLLRQAIALVSQGKRNPALAALEKAWAATPPARQSRALEVVK